MSEANQQRPAARGPTARPIEALLARLEAAYQTGAGQWLARCPAHHDQRPSLSLRELDDGALLVHCFAGCASADVLDAVGLRFADLYPFRPAERSALAPAKRWIPRDVLAAVAHEALVTAIAAEGIATGNTLGAVDRDRLRTASIRLRAAAREVGCG